MAANGFVGRDLGKVKVQQLWLGKQALNGAPSVANLSTVAGVGQTIPEQAHLVNIASSAASVFPMQALPGKGQEQRLNLIPSTTGAGAIFVTAPAGLGFGFSTLDPSTFNTIKSTYPMVLTLIGVSSLRAGIGSVFPQSTAGVAPLSGVTLSTTT